jgi:hypothetical protein
MVDYITNEDTIIFSPHYNKTMDIDLLTLHNNIIFSDYELSEDLFEKYENLDLEDLTYIGSHFNQEVTLPENLTHLTFGRNFNQEVVLPNNLTHLTFGSYFDQEVELPKNLTHLTFGNWFNQEVHLPKNLTYLTFGFYFNQKVELLENLTHLTFGHCFNQKVELPENLTYLTFGYYFNQEVHLPENLTHLTFGYNFNQKVELPLGIKYLRLENDKVHNLDYLPEGIEVLELGKYFNDDTLCNLPNSLKVIKLYKKCECNLKCLPTNTEIEYYE